MSQRHRGIWCLAVVIMGSDLSRALVRRDRPVVCSLRTPARAPRDVGVSTALIRDLATVERSIASVASAQPVPQHGNRSCEDALPFNGEGEANNKSGQADKLSTRLLLPWTASARPGQQLDRRHKQKIIWGAHR